MLIVYFVCSFYLLNITLQKAQVNGAVNRLDTLINILRSKPLCVNSFLTAHCYIFLLGLHWPSAGAHQTIKSVHRHVCV